MNYICHTPYNKIGASGKKYDIKRGEEFVTIGHYIATGPEAICAVRSDDAFHYFSRNDDNNGLKRGELTYKIAFSERHNKEDGFRFSPKERELLVEKYSKFIDISFDFIIFTYEFFNADIEELEQLIKDLESLKNEEEK